MSRGNTEDHLQAKSIHSKYGSGSHSNTSNVSPRSHYQNPLQNPFNQTGASIANISSTTNTANIKGKITAIEVLILRLGIHLLILGYDKINLRGVFLS